MVLYWLKSWALSLNFRDWRDTEIVQCYYSDWNFVNFHWISETLTDLNLEYDRFSGFTSQALSWNDRLRRSLEKKDLFIHFTIHNTKYRPFFNPHPTPSFSNTSGKGRNANMNLSHLKNVSYSNRRPNPNWFSSLFANFLSDFPISEGLTFPANFNDFLQFSLM